MKKLALCTLSLALLIGAPTFAEDAPKPDAPKGDKPKGEKGDRPKHGPDDLFKHLDTTGDGKLSLDEFKAGKKFKDNAAGAEAKFKELDTDKDNSISREEFKAGFKHHGEGKGKGKGKGEKPAEAK